MPDSYRFLTPESDAYYQRTRETPIKPMESTRDYRNRLAQEDEKLQQEQERARKQAESDLRSNDAYLAGQIREADAVITDYPKARQSQESTLRTIEDEWAQDEITSKKRSLFGFGAPTPEAQEAQARLETHKSKWIEEETKLKGIDSTAVESKKKKQQLEQTRAPYRSTIDALDAQKFNEIHGRLTGEQAPATGPANQLPPHSPVSATPEPQPAGPLQTNAQSSTPISSNPEQNAQPAPVSQTYPQARPMREWTDADKAAWRKLTPEQKRTWVANSQKTAQEAGDTRRESAQVMADATTGKTPGFWDLVGEATAAVAAPILKGASTLGTGVLGATAAAQELAGFDAQNNTQAMALGIQQYWDEAIPEGVKDSAQAKLAEGLGSALTFLPGGALGAATNAPKVAVPIISAVTGALINGGSTYLESKEMGLSDDKAFARTAVGLGLGTTEAIGIGRVFAKLNQFTKGGLTKFFTELAGQGVEEGAQEAFQSAATDIADLLILDANDPRKKSLEKIWQDARESGLYGAATGILFAGIVGSASRRDAAQQSITLDSTIQELSAEADRIDPRAASADAADAINAEAIRSYKGDLESDMQGFDPANGNLTYSDSEHLAVLTVKRDALRGIDRTQLDTDAEETINQAEADLTQIIERKAVTPEQIHIATELLAGHQGNVLRADQEITQARAELDALNRETFLNPVDLSRKLELQQQLAGALQTKIQLAAGDADPKFAAEVQKLLPLAKTIASYPDQPADPNANGKPNGSSQRQIAMAIGKLSQGLSLTDAESNLLGSNGRPVFSKDKKTGLVSLINPQTENALRQSSPQLLTAYENRPIPQPVQPSAPNERQETPAPIQRPAASSSDSTNEQPAGESIVSQDQQSGLTRYRLPVYTRGNEAGDPRIVEFQAGNLREAQAMVNDGVVFADTPLASNEVFNVADLVASPSQARASTPAVTSNKPQAQAKSQKIEQEITPIIRSIERFFPNGVAYTDTAYGSGGFLFNNNQLVISRPDFDSQVANVTDAKRKLVQELAHSILVDAEQQGVFDAQGIYSNLPARLQRHMAGAYRVRPDSQNKDWELGHEFLRMVVEQKIKLDADGTLTWSDAGGQLLSEQANPSLYAQIKDALSRVLEYFQNLEARLRSEGTDEATIRSIKDAEKIVKSAITRNFPNTESQVGQKGKSSGSYPEEAGSTPAPATISSTAPANVASEGMTGGRTTVYGQNNEPIDATYIALPDGTVQTSHIGEQFRSNPRYPLQNTRDYNKETREQEKVLQGSRNLRPALIVSTAASAAEGPPQVILARWTENGQPRQEYITVGGNGREQMINLSPPTEKEGLSKAFAAKLADFGFTAQPPSGSRVYRFLGEFNLDDPAQANAAQELVDAMNPTVQADQGNSRRAELDAAKLPPARLRGISANLPASDAQVFLAGLLRDATTGLDANRLRAVADDPNAAKLYVQRLITQAAFNSTGINNFVQNPDATNRQSNALREVILTVADAALELRQKDQNGIADAISRTLERAVSNLKGNATLDAVLRQTAEQTEADLTPGSDSQTAQAIADAMARKLAYNLTKSGQTRFDLEASLEGITSLMQDITTATANFDAEPDIFGQSEDIRSKIQDAITAHFRRADLADMEAQAAQSFPDVEPENLLAIAENALASQPVRVNKSRMPGSDRAAQQSQGQPSPGGQQAEAQIDAAAKEAQAELDAKRTARAEADRVRIVEDIDRDPEDGRVWISEWKAPEGEEYLTNFVEQPSIYQLADGRFTVGESPEIYNSLADAETEVRRMIRESVQDQGGTYGSDMDAQFVSSLIFEAFPRIPNFKTAGWFGTKWGSWYLEGRFGNGDLVKVSVRDHDVSRRDTDKAFFVSKDWRPEEVARALKNAYRWLYKKANPNQMDGAAGIKTESRPAQNLTEIKSSGNRFIHDIQSGSSESTASSDSKAIGDSDSGSIPDRAGRARDNEAIRGELESEFRTRGALLNPNPPRTGNGALASQAAALTPQNLETISRQYNDLFRRQRAGERLNPSQQQYFDRLENLLGQRLLFDAEVARQTAPEDNLASADTQPGSNLPEEANPNQLTLLESGNQEDLFTWRQNRLSVNPNSGVISGKEKKYKRSKLSEISNATEISEAEYEALLNEGLSGDWKKLKQYLDNRPNAASVYPEFLKNSKPWNVIGTKIATSHDLAAILAPLRSPIQESLKVVVLDDNNRVVSAEIVSLGTLNQALAESRDVFRSLAILKATSGKRYKKIVLSHNHPSGNPDPSNADILVTKKLSDIAKSVGFEVVDHIITNGKSFHSINDATTYPINNPQLAEWERVDRSNLQKLTDTDLFRSIVTAVRTPESGHIFYLSNKLHLIGVTRIPQIASAKSEDVLLQLLEGSSLNGASAFLADLGNAPDAQYQRLLNSLTEFSKQTKITLHDVARVDPSNPNAFYTQQLGFTTESLYSQSVSLEEQSLGAADVLEKFERLPERAQTGQIDNEARSLIVENLPLAGWFAQRYNNVLADAEDIQQEARMGLIDAALQYDSKRGDFSGFASRVIQNRLLKSYRRTANARARDGGSLNESIGVAEDSVERLSLIPAKPQQQSPDPDGLTVLRKLMRVLPQVDKAILRGISQGKDLRSIGKDVNLSHEGVRKRLKASTQWLRENLTKRGIRSTDDIFPVEREIAQDALLSQGQAFYSNLQRVINDKMPSVASVEQIKGIINPEKGSGVKAEEIKWSGIIPWLESQTGPITKDQVLEYLRTDGSVRFEEVTLGGATKSWTQEDINRLEREAQRTRDWTAYERAVLEFEDQQLGSDANNTGNQTQYAQYQLPGGENYREVVLALPPEKTWLDGSPVTAKQWDDPDTREAALRLPGNGGYTSSHFPDVPNYVAHMRLNEREDADGKPGLFIEEIQSDRHQDGRKKGYALNLGEKPTQAYAKQLFGISDADWSAMPEDQRQSYVDEIVQGGKHLKGAIPDAPFRTTWALAMFKRALRDAVVSGKDWIGWTTGHTQAERYDLSKQVDHIAWTKNPDGTKHVEIPVRGADQLFAFNIDENGIVGKGQMTNRGADYIGKPLSEVIGKEAAERVMEKPSGKLIGNDLKVGGSGMRGFYDVMLPKEIGKYVKQWGAKVEIATIPLDNQIWRVTITPQMRQSIQENGQPLYSQSNPFGIDYVRMERLIDTAYQETNGDRTIGNWKLAHSLDNETYMGVDQYRKAQMQQQRETEWQDIAEKVYAADPQLVESVLMQKALAGEVLNPVETKAAYILVNDLAQRPGSDENRKKLYNLTFAIRETGSAAGRALRARVDTQRTPEERWRAFFAKRIFDLPPKRKKELAQAPSEATKAQELAALQQQLTAMGGRNAELEQQIKDLKEQATKEQILDNDYATRLKQMEDALRRMGVTLDDILTGKIELRLMGAKIIQDVAESLADREKRIMRALQGKRAGQTLAQISQRLSVPLADVKRVNADFREKLKEQLKAQFIKGIRLDELEMAGVDDVLRAQPATRQAISEAEAEKMAEKALRMMGFYSNSEFDRIKVRKSRPQDISPDQTAPRRPWPNAPTGEGKVTPDGRLDLDFQDQPWEGPTGEGRTGERGLFPDLERPWTGDVAYYFDPASDKDMLHLSRAIDVAKGGSWVDYATEIAIANLLSAPLTQITNTIGYGYGIYDMSFKRALEATLNQFKGKKGSAQAAQFGEFRHMLRALSPGISRAWINAQQAWATESPIFERDVLNDQLELEWSNKSERIRAYVPEDVLSRIGAKVGMEQVAANVEGALGKLNPLRGRVVRLPFRFMQATDDFFKTLMGQMNAAAYAYRDAKSRGLTGPSMERYIAAQLAGKNTAAWQKAAETANTYSYTRPLRPWSEIKDAGEAGILEAGLKWINDIKNTETADADIQTKLAVLALRAFFPFIRTPYRLIELGWLNSLPGAMLENVFNRGKRTIVDPVTGQKMQVIRADKAKATAAQATLLQAMLWTTLLAYAGEGDEGDDQKPFLITGSPQQSRNVSAMQRRTTPPFSVKIGDMVLSYERFDPFSTMIAIPVDFAREIKEYLRGKPLQESSGSLLSSLYKQILEKASLRGFSELNNLFAGQTNLPEWAVQQAAAWTVPNLIRNPLRAADDFVRDTQTQPLSPQNIAYQFVPAPQLAPPPRIDPTGRPMEKRGNFFSRLLVPGQPGVPQSTSAIDAFAQRYNLRHPNEKWAPGIPKPFYSRNGKQVEMTPQQAERFYRVRARLFRQYALETGVLSRRSPTEDDKKLLENAGMKATREAKSQLFGN